MDAEFLQLAREAVAALQGPRWVEITQAVASVVGLGCIVGGLFSMKAAGKRRDREIDELAAAFRKQGEAMTQAFTQQGEAMTQAFTQQGQALERQGQALEALLRRTGPA
ncbi:MAG: hypothetical protein OXF79_30050 [Chloroflexi bacterium]|nr:hypothetical protein [Chloroflexota bacterium]